MPLQRADTPLCAFGVSVLSRPISWHMKEKKNGGWTPLSLLRFSFRILDACFFVETGIKLVKPSERGPSQEVSAQKNKAPVRGFVLSVLCLAPPYLLLSLSRCLYVNVKPGYWGSVFLLWNVDPHSPWCHLRHPSVPRGLESGPSASPLHSPLPKSLSEPQICR